MREIMNQNRELPRVYNFDERSCGAAVLLAGAAQLISDFVAQACGEGGTGGREQV